MKKILLGSSALVGASLLGAVPVAAAEAPSISFSGWTRVEMVMIDQDLSAGRGRGYDFDVDSNYLVWSAKGTADNGMTYTASTSVSTGAGAIVTDEAKITLTNQWGTVIMGDDDGADDVMMVGGYSLMTAGYGYDGGYTSNVNRGGVGFTGVFASLTGDTGDATKISYYTPRWSGLQLGASWTPDSGAAFDQGANEPDNDGDRENTFGAGLNYNGKVGEVGVRVGITGVVGSTEPSSISASGTSSLARDDISSWSAGGTLSYSGFSIGAGHGDSGDSNCTKANTLCDQGEWWDISGQYKFGGTTIATGYLNNESNATGSAVKDDDVDVWTLGINHDFASAPGMRAWAEITQYEVDRAGTVSDNDATYVMIGTQVAF